MVVSYVKSHTVVCHDTFYYCLGFTSSMGSDGRSVQGIRKRPKRFLLYSYGEIPKVELSTIFGSSEQYLIQSYKGLVCQTQTNSSFTTFLSNSKVVGLLSVTFYLVD